MLTANAQKEDSMKRTRSAADLLNLRVKLYRARVTHGQIAAACSCSRSLVSLAVIGIRTSPGAEKILDYVESLPERLAA